MDVPDDDAVVERVARSMWLCHFSEDPKREGPFADRHPKLRRVWLEDARAAIAEIRQVLRERRVGSGRNMPFGKGQLSRGQA